MKLSGFLLLASCLSGAHSTFLGPVYPPPKDLTSSDSCVAAAWKNMTRTLERSFQGQANSSGLNGMTFSVGSFSTQDPKAEKLQYHHTAPEIINAKNGTHKVDGDSIYRIASVSKLFTVFAGMIELTLEDWETPLSDILPEFAQFLREKSDTLDPAFDTQWDKITPFALASNMGGIAAGSTPWVVDWVTLAASSEQIAEGQIQERWGLPFVDRSNPANWGPCSNAAGLQGICSPENYTIGASTHPPVALPWTLPSYSNNGFVLLGLAMANLTGRSLDDIYRETLFDPLGMKSSWSVIPPESELHRSVIAGDMARNWANANGISKTSGGIYSTLNDLAKFSTGLLNSTLLPTHKTRRWMKPVSLMSNLHRAVGAPWEIYRWEDPTTGHITDVYTKLGDSGNYGAMAVFLPDFDAGFNIITASSKDTRSQQTLSVVQNIMNSYIPALTAQAGKELRRKFVGTYVSTTKDLNSSITFVPSTNNSQGLQITSFVSNGTDLTPLLTGNGLIDSKPYALQPIIRPDDKTGKTVFRPSVAPPDPILPRDPSNLFTSFYDADQFARLGQPVYAAQYTTEFVFNADAEGKVESVTLPAWRVTLEKK